MKVSELGEFGLIDLLARMVNEARESSQEAWQKVIIGIGDDAAAWQGETSTQLATVDGLVQGVHFSLDTIGWHDLGWKALAVNLSDIAAMGGVPRYALVSLAIPDQTEVADVAALYEGMIELARQFEVAIVGGDTDSAPLVAVTVTVMGSTGGTDKPMLTRSAARPGDRVAVTGYLGTAAAGWEMLTKKLSLSAEASARLERAFRRPTPRVAEGRLLAGQGVRTAIDISDGLISDLGHVCQASGVGARIEVERLPVMPAVTASFGPRARELTLSGGEDYELLFTAGAEVVDKAQQALSCPVTVIGEITADKPGKITLLDEKGKPFKLKRSGWEHFTPKASL